MAVQRRQRNPLNNVKIIQYGASDGANLLRQELGVRRLIRPVHEVPREWKLINWGNSKFQTRGVAVVNNPEAVSTAKNKRLTLETLERSGVSVPEFTTDIEIARMWAREGDAVVQRATLYGKAGEGITIADNSLDIVQNPLYTKYIKKKEEWRIHIAFGQVIDFARKIKTQDGVITGDARVRSHVNGYVFSKNREVIGNPRQSILDEAVKSVAALGLDFGGVDVIFNERANKAYVLEINTAPGIEGSTVKLYADAFRKHFT